MIVFSIITLVGFCLLRPKNKIVYQPKAKYYVDARTKPPEVGNGILDWIGPILKTKEDVCHLDTLKRWELTTPQALFDKIGMDGVTFLRFLRMSRWMFIIIAVLVCGVLMPANIVYNVKDVNSADRDTLSMLTILSVRGNLLYLHVAMTCACLRLLCSHC